MALISKLTRVFGRGRVAYFKPVGHHWVEADTAGGVCKVDKDALVAKVHFGLSADVRDMSPLIISSGYTRRFLDGQIDTDAQWERISNAFETLRRTHDYVVVEGTGHTAVGSVVGVSNATVAARLGLGVALVANGGVGSTFDELELNRQMLASEGAELKGVVVNKVKPKKFETVCGYMDKAVRRWGVPLLGCVPYGEGFDRPSMRDLELLFGETLLSGWKHRLRRLERYELVTTSLGRFMHKLNHVGSPSGGDPRFAYTASWAEPGMREEEAHPPPPPPPAPSSSSSSSSPLAHAQPNDDGHSQPRDDFASACFITHTSRVDIILGLLSHAHDLISSQGETGFKGALLLTGTNIDLPVYVQTSIQNSRVPVLKTGLSTAETIQRLEGFTAKMHKDDRHRTDAVIDLYEPRLDIEPLLSSSHAQASSAPYQGGAASPASELHPATGHDSPAPPQVAMA